MQRITHSFVMHARAALQWEGGGEIQEKYCRADSDAPFISAPVHDACMHATGAFQCIAHARNPACGTMHASQAQSCGRAPFSHRFSHRL